MRVASRCCGRLLAWVFRHFARDTRGNVAIIFALASTAMLVGIGSGIDLSRAYFARQKLSEVATLTCQFATRPSAYDVGAMALYTANVNQFASSTLTSQNWPAASLPTGGASGAYFTATGASSTSSAQVPTGIAELSYNMPTSFLKIINVSQITVHAMMNCQPPAKASSTTPGATLVNEGFETGHTGYYFTLPSGQVGTQSTPLQTFPASAGYQGDNGNQFYIMGYCLEIDAAGVINASDPQGTHSAELDCDNGQGGAGNSSISTKTYMAAGYYELRYFYRSRVDYANYDPTYICGSTASDVSWANDPGNGSNGQRTNQINVYLDQSVSNGPPPTHTTIDGSQQLAGANLIDTCVYSINWVERSVKIKITTAGSYWLSFAADGNNDSLGAQIDSIRVCVEQCGGTLQDNFPSSWLAANNGGSNKVLFEDAFEAPTYTTDPSATSPHARAGNMNLSLGTTASSASSCYSPFGAYQTPPGWPCQAANGWSTAPYNETEYFLRGAYQGAQYIQLDGSNYASTGSQSTNRLISRPFLLDPGYYQVSYDYISNTDFKSTVNIAGNYCYAAPASGPVFPVAPPYPSETGQNRYQSGTSTSDVSTNILGVFMSHGQMVSTPALANAPWSTSTNASPAAPSVGATTSYNNPDGSTSTTPTKPPDAVNWVNYNASAANPVLDACGYVDSFQWVARSVYVKIPKAGVYWLTFSANGGLADGTGPGIDDVKVTAIGSPVMANAPTYPLVTIPTPTPAANTNWSNGGAFTGFNIVADPFAPPAADQ